MEYHDAEESLYIAYLLSDALEIKTFPYLGDKITSDLRKLNVIQEQAVILIDHHAVSHHNERLKYMEFDKVMVYPICPCCINLEDGRGKLENDGLKVEPSIAAVDAYYPAVLEEIKKKIAG